MKSNKSLKTAALLVMLCLITTCAIGTTFARYTTSGSTGDSARVAKWGVVLTIDGDTMFSNQYATDDTTNYAGSVSVLSQENADGSSDKVVAPGTASVVKTDSTGALVATNAKFSIKGAPEVAVNVNVEITDVSDIFLKAGTYTDYTIANDGNGDEGDGYTSTFDLADDYYPVIFTLNKDGSQVATGTLQDIYDYFATNWTNVQYAPNTTLDVEFELSWAWAIDQNNQADTLLGNLAEGTATLDDATLYSTNVSYGISISVTQID